MPNNLCQYATANINAAAPGAIGYSWIGPNNFSSNQQTAVIPNIQPNGTGTYYATATFAIGSVSCTITGSNQLSIVPVNPIIVTPTVSVCEPNNAFLSSNSTGAATYSWSGPNSYSANIANPTIYLPTPSISGIYTVSTSYNNGSFTCYNSNTVQLIINPRLTFTLDAYRKMCYNSLLNVNGPAGATSYSWTSSTGFTSNTQNLTIPSIQPNQSGTYTLNVALGNCITTQKIQIEVLTPLSYTLTPPNQTICKGDSVKLFVGSTGGSENYAYVWTPSIFLGSPTGSVQYGHPLGTTIYNLAGWDIACPNYTVFYTFTVQVNQPPVPDLQLEKEQGCQPLCLFYNTKTQNQAAITTYDFGGTNVMQADSFTYCLQEPGTYYLKIESLGKNGCRGVFDYPAPIVVFPKPQSDFTWSPDVVTTSDNKVTFDPTYKYGPITSINWMFSGTGIEEYDTTNLKNPQRVFETPGKYPIMLIQRTDKGCIDSVVKYIEIREDFNVFIPNTFTPNGDGNNDVFNVKGLGLKVTGFSMELFDRWGHSMFSTKDITKGWDGTVKGQPAQDGVYIYKILAVGANGEGRKEYVGHVTLMK
jgi:gliding motility-associated-like protein